MGQGGYDAFVVKANANTKEPIMGAELVGHVVQLVVNGEPVLFGLAEYVTRDGWVGIRGPGGRLDEAPLEQVEPDPT